MLDSIDLQQGDKNNINSFQAINQLKQGLKQEVSSQNDFQENKKTKNEVNLQSPNILISNDTKNLSKSEHIKSKKSKSPSQKPILNGKSKNTYSNFIKNIRATTPVLNSLSNSNLNTNKNRIRPTSSFTRTLNNFFQRNKLLINDDDDKSSFINDDPIKLRNQFQHYLGKANEKTTKEVSFQKLKEIITNNHSTENLRVYISCLSTYSRNATVFGMEIYALLYGYISGVYKENLMDPIDNPPNIIKTINRILGHLRQFYLGSNSYMVHKSISRSMCDIYDNCMPKDNVKSIYMIFFEPLFEILSNGIEKSTQEGAAICLMDFIYHLGENRKKNNINKKILDTIDEKIISLCTKSSLDNPYLFEALYNLINFNKIEKFSNYLKEIYDRFIIILCKTNKNKYNYLMKLNSLKILNLIGSKIRNIADISIGYFQDEILKVIEFNTKDKNNKVQLQAKKTLKTWKELKNIYEDIDIKKREIKDDISKDDFINNNLINKKLSANDDEEDEEEDNETINEKVNNDKNNGFSTVVRKMDKLNFLRNLAKRAKIENQKIDYDSQLPEKMKEEVYKKGISNILNFSKFLKNRLQTKESAEFKKEEVSPNKRKGKKNKMKNEIRDYLKHSKQVKKYDSIKKMEHDNIISKDKSYKNINNNNINNIENDNNNIIKEENESNYNVNENNNEINNINEDENNNKVDNNNVNNNFVEEIPIQGQNFENFENVKKDEINNNQEEISQEDNNNQNQIENENENENDIEQNNQEDKINTSINNIQDNKNLNNSQISDTKNSKVNQNLNEVNEQNTINIKNNLQKIFNDVIYKSFDEFEKNITDKLNQMNNRINEISLKISDYQSNQFNVNEGDFSKNKKIIDNNCSQSSYRPTSIVENNSFYINSRKMKLNSLKDTKNNSINTDEPDFFINNNLNKRESTSIDSEVTKTWKETLQLIERGNINEGFLKLINSGDDIYLLRLICLTGPIIDKLDIEVAKRVLLRVNMISKSHQIQQLLIGLIKNSIKNNIFQSLDPNQQNYVLDSLYEFSGLNNSIATEAAELYAELTK